MVDFSVSSCCPSLSLLRDGEDLREKVNLEKAEHPVRRKKAP